MNYIYLVEKVRSFKEISQKIGRFVGIDEKSFINDMKELGCHIIASDSCYVTSEKQRSVINECLGVSVTASDVYQCKSSNSEYKETYPKSFVGFLTFDAMTKNNSLTQTLADFMAEFAYCIMCADDKFSAVQEAYWNNLIEHYINDGNLVLKHYKLVKPMPTIIALCENPQRDPFKRRYLYDVNEQTIANELAAHKIPATPVYKYRSFGNPFYVALYPSNSIQGNIAIVAGKNLYILNLFEMDIGECTISAYNDMEGIHKSIAGGIVGGPAWGAFLAAVSQNHTIIEELSCTITDKANNEKIKIVFSKNEKFNGNEWDKTFNGAKGFTDSYLNVINKVTNIETARKLSYKSYGYENDTLTRNWLKKQGLSPDGKDFRNIN
ncbi:MAG: hypothetical protein IJA87_07535 [Clostridia bacterium]|nr:hypothetical protein [Clostridia bacterium]